MFNPTKCILFATNLSPVCRAAFEASISLAAQYQATLVLLHVIDRDVPTHVEEHLRTVLGAEKYDELLQTHQRDARQALIGKMSSDSLMHTALKKYCADAGITDVNTGLRPPEFAVVEGDVIQEILAAAKKYDCDMIVMGARKGFLRNNSMGAHVKGVMRSTKVPVLFVPPHPGDED